GVDRQGQDRSSGGEVVVDLRVNLQGARGTRQVEEDVGTTEDRAAPCEGHPGMELDVAAESVVGYGPIVGRRALPEELDARAGRLEPSTRDEAAEAVEEHGRR